MPILEPDDELVTAADLSGFEGAPFDDATVRAACVAVRSAARWHIAPEIEETLTVEPIGGPRALLLQTMHLVEVTEIRDVTDDPVGVEVTGYRTHVTDRFKGGIIDRPGGWPRGAVLEVDVKHGYDGCPADLAAAVAELCRLHARGDLASRSLGDRSESWRAALSPASQQALSAYEIPGSP